MSKKDNIELFLLQLQLLSQKVNVTPTQVYLQLISYGISDNQQFQSINKVFDEQIEINKNNKYMNVFIDKNHENFCQFVSKDIYKNDNYVKKHLKIYIPLKQEEISKNISYIFKKINDKKIVYHSKLSKKIRCDNLVIRLLNPSDEKYIANIVNKLPDNKIGEINPFVINDGKIGVTYDGNLSYNDTLSYFISKYVKEENNKKSSVSYDKFLNYLERQLSRLESKKNLSDIMNITTHGKSNSNRLITIEEILNIAIMNLNGSTVEDLLNYFNYINTPEYVSKKEEEYKEFNTIEDNKNLLKEIISTMLIKYGKEKTKECINFYKNYQNLDGITRTNNLRNRVMNKKSFITYINMLDIESIIDREAIILKCDEISIDSLKKDVILENICKDTYLSFQNEERQYSGKIQVATLLIRMEYGDYNNITRTNNARNLAKEKIKPEEVQTLIKNSLTKNGYIIENEEDLYESYANYIESICNKRGKTK